MEVKIYTQSYALHHSREREKDVEKPWKIVYTQSTNNHPDGPNETTPRGARDDGFNNGTVDEDADDENDDDDDGLILPLVVVLFSFGPLLPPTPLFSSVTVDITLPFPNQFVCVPARVCVWENTPVWNVTFAAYYYRATTIVHRVHQRQQHQCREDVSAVSVTDAAYACLISRWLSGAN